MATDSRSTIRWGRDQDGRMSKRRVEKIAREMGLSVTALVHHALARLENELLREAFEDKIKRNREAGIEYGEAQDVPIEKLLAMMERNRPY